MTKEDIYRIIGYNGEYTLNVKKSIRKLLKDNHPDNKGNKERFELINEVKKELENNKVSLNIKNNNLKNKYNDIDYDYCKKMINIITEQKNKLKKEYEIKKQNLSNIEKEYHNLYRKNIDLELNLLTSSREIKKIKVIKNISIIFLIVLIMVYILSIIKDSIIFLIVFVLLIIICIIIIEKYFILFNNITQNNKAIFKKYVSSNNIMRNNINKQEELLEDIMSIKKKIASLDNDLRFYENLLKK